MTQVKLTFLGTGTSQGVPMIGCGCEVCTSPDMKDKRLRSSVLVDWQGMRILVDAGPDFRWQMLRAGVKHLDAILLTHNHKDHTGGLDDIRAFNYLERHPSEIWCEQYVAESLKKEYSYAFEEKKYPGAPEWNIHLIENKPFEVASYKNTKVLSWESGVGYSYQDAGVTPEIDKSVKVIPIRGMHYKLPVLGFRFGNIAYCTDMNYIPEEEFNKLKGLDHFVINTVKNGKHISHFSLEEAIATARKVGAKHSWLTHLSHQLPRHEELAASLPEGILPAYDGLVITSEE
ncbi:MAG: MBL fold metallo-hydrolase [Candidatus Cryptobacteroides sp.]